MSQSLPFRREAMLDRLSDRSERWDLLVIGGGATGLGCAVEGASRGYRTLLVEASDFSSGTSSRSTKLVHGGVRYLRQGNISLVLEALKERGVLRNNAPHLVHDLPFVVPNYDWWEAPFYGIGLRLYDALAGKLGFGPSRNLTKQQTLERLPTIETEGLRGGVIYHDGQFDDARLAVDLAVTAAEQGATLVNYAAVVALLKTSDVSSGAIVRDVETGREHAVAARVIVNATGPFTDDVRRLDDAEAPPMIRPSQGVHIVLDPSFLPGDSAIMVPHTDDGRVLFAIPWHDRIVVGTTDTPLSKVVSDPRPLPEEIEFLLTHTARYLTKDPEPSDILSAFAGIRPLVSAAPESDTAALSRDHTIHISRSGLVTIAGGKWTTYRRMGEDVIGQAAAVGHLDERPSITGTLRIHGFDRDASRFEDLAPYGADAPALRGLLELESEPEYSKPLHPRLRARVGEVVWAARNEMARTVDDVLSRRTRSLVLDARASIEAAPTVARVLARELGRDAEWEREQVASFERIGENHLPD